MGEDSSTGGMRAGARAGDLEPGTMVGEFRVEGQLGEGGMGKVYAAMHPVIAKRAAIKVLHPELSVNTEAVERFVQEARSVNQIGHPNIVDIFAFGTLPDGRSYFVMEWLRGESLRERVDRSLPSVAETLQILDTIAVALEAAHETGIVHRDLKPDNVFLVEIKGAAPQVKLLDFGIAKLLGGNELRAERTRTGNLMGTPAYISPEQARGYAVDHRTDIYALGAVAYEMLTQWLPFPSDNGADMVAKHLFEPPPRASARNPEVTPELDQLLISMMAKDAADRPSLSEVRRELRTFFNRFLITGPTGPHGPLADNGLRGSSPYLRPHITPAPGTLPPTSDSPAPVGPRSAYQTAAQPPAKRSRTPIVVVSILLVAGLGVGAYLGLTTRDTAKSSPEPATAVETVPPVEVVKPADVAKPADMAKPVGAAKPIDTAKPVDTATVAKPADSTDSTLIDPAKPAGSVPTAKPITKKRPAKTPKTGTKPGPTPVDDPDAPM